MTNEGKWINLLNGRRFRREDDGAVTYENAYQGASMTFPQEDWLAVVVGCARPDIDPETVRRVIEQVHVTPVPEPAPAPEPIAAEPLPVETPVVDVSVPAAVEDGA